MQKQINTKSPSNKKLLRPIIVSILLHAFIIWLVFFWQKSNTTTANNRVETALVTPEQLNNIQKQQASQQQSQNIATHQSNKTTKLPQNTTHDLQSEFDDLMPYGATSAETNTQSIEPNIPSNLTTKTTKPENQSIFTPSTAQADNYIPDEYEQISGLDSDINQSSNNNPVNTTQVSQNIEQQTAIPPTTSQNNQSTQQESASTPASTSNLLAIKSKISAYLPPPNELPDADKSTTKLTLHIDKNGYIIDSSTTGSNSQLNDASIAAAYKAQPLPIDVNDPQTYPTINITLNGKGVDIN